MQLLTGNIEGIIVNKDDEHKTITKQEKTIKMKASKHDKSEHDKWKDIRSTRKFRDVSEMSYWNMISNCSIL